MPATYYPAVIDRSASGFGVSFPDFPGCIAAGASPHVAAINAEAALALHLDAMRGDGDAIPAPSSLDDIEAVEGAEDVARVLIRADMPGKFVRVQVTLDENLLGQIDGATHNRSGFLADAARAMLAKEAWELRGRLKEIKDGQTYHEAQGGQKAKDVTKKIKVRYESDLKRVKQDLKEVG